jgi:hypothetical protein
MPIAKKFGAVQRNVIGALLISHRYWYKIGINECKYALEKAKK